MPQYLYSAKGPLSLRHVVCTLHKTNVTYLEELVESLFTLPIGAGIPGVPWVLFDQLSDVFEGGVQSDLFAFFQESSVVVFLFGNFVTLYA